MTWEQEIEKLKNKWPEPEKFIKKYEELRCKEVKSIIFDKTDVKFNEDNWKQSTMVWKSSKMNKNNMNSYKMI